MRSLRVVLACVVFVLVVAGALFAGGRPISKSVWPMTFDGRNGCTVTSINEPKHLWLTAAHCVDTTDDVDDLGEPKPVVRAIKGEPIHNIVFDKKHDLAIVQTLTVSAPAVKLADHAPSVPVPGSDDQDSLVYVVGYPFGFPFQVNVRGYAAALSGVLDAEDTQKYALFNLTGAPGNSGSAILNADGKIVSVLQVGWGRSFSPMVGGVVFADLAAYRQYFAK